jgi:hypothetical protein
MKTRILLLSALFGAYLVFVSGCKDDEDDSFKAPSSSCFEMDFSFSTMQKSFADSSDYENYLTAKKIIDFWSVEIDQYTVLPFKTYSHILSTESTNENSGYDWTVNFSIGSSDFLGYMYAKSSDSISWEMDIATVGTNYNYLYCEGKSTLDKTSGWWVIYNPINEKETPVIKVNWHYQSDDSCKLKYTILYSNDNYYGSYIEYVKSNNTSTNRYYSTYINNYSESEFSNKVIRIDWNSSGKNGQIEIDDTLLGSWDNNCYDL